MNGISAFFRNIVRSCYDLEFYREVRTAPARKSFWYLLSLVAVFVLLGAVQLVPSALRGRDRLAEELRTRVPDGAILEVKEDRLSTNLPLPFDIGIPGSSVILDTSVEGTESRDVPDGTLIIGRDALFFDDTSGNHIAPYSDIESFTLTKDAAVTTVLDFPTALIVAAIALLALLMHLFLLLGVLLYVLFASAGAFAVTRIAKMPFRFGQWFAVGCHAATLPLVATALIGPWLNHVPFARAALFLMIIIAVMVDERSNPTGAAHGPAKPAAKEQEKKRDSEESGKKGA